MLAPCFSAEPNRHWVLAWQHHCRHAVLSSGSGAKKKILLDTCPVVASNELIVTAKSAFLVSMDADTVRVALPEALCGLSRECALNVMCLDRARIACIRKDGPASSLLLFSAASGQLDEIPLPLEGESSVCTFVYFPGAFDLLLVRTDSAACIVYLPVRKTKKN